MYQQRVRLHQISTIALGLACIIAIIAIIKGQLILVLSVNYCIAVSLVCDGLVFKMSFKKQTSLRLLLLGALLFSMTTYLLFLYWKSS